MATSELTDPKYWSANFGKQKPFKFGKSSYHKYLTKYLHPDPSKTCIEIGAYPGGNLGYMAKFFLYKPTALDFVEELDFVDTLMQYNGIKDCKTINEDFLKWQPTTRYDVVCSHGFVEHFLNYEDVIEKHVSILSPGGTLVLTVPYLDYYQLWIRKILYTTEKYEKVMSIHNTDVMKLTKLKNIIRDKFGLTLRFAKYIKGMKIWFPANAETIQMNKIGLYNLAKKIGDFTEKREMSNKFISPEILIIAEKDS